MKNQKNRPKANAWLALTTVTLVALFTVLLVAGVKQSTTVHALQLPVFNSTEADAAILQASSANYPNCRFGVGGNIDGYDVASLNVGWHLNFGTWPSPARPNGAEYIQIVRLSPALGSGYVFTPSVSTLYQIMDQNPGSTWLIGNEPDSPFQDNLIPETYARAYHDLYSLIKQHDPTAQVGIAGVVQPTPLRFQYLDRVWNAYEQNYGERLPTDLWNIHSYILREIDYSDPQACLHPETGCLPGQIIVWGAFIPPGLSATRGIIYNESDMFSTSIFQQRLLDMRRWMADHGERDKPLYITEYGELFPYPPYMPNHDPDPYVDENGVPITEVRAAAFMTATFNMMQNASDPGVGYPSDGNRLVQRWLWFSTDYTGYGGVLFDPVSHQRSQLGNVFYTYTHALSPSVDLLAVSVEASPAAMGDTGQPHTTTLKALISNVGNVSVTTPITVAFYAGQPPLGTLISSAQVIPAGLKGCAATAGVTVTWPNLVTGVNRMYVQVDPGNLINEANRANNIATGYALVTNQHVYLPIIAKAFAPKP